MIMSYYCTPIGMNKTHEKPMKMTKLKAIKDMR
jgi:hypothetical protein